jgi:hypothetical protein
MPTPATGYARLNKLQARIVLAGLLLASGLGVAVTLSPLAQSNADRSDRGPGDVALYRAEADRIHDGEGYYQAIATELRARGYPTRSVFNWRMPLPVWLIGNLPTVESGKIILGGFALMLILLGFEVVAGAGDCPDFRVSDNGTVPFVVDAKNGAVRQAAVCILLLSGPLMFCVLGDLFVMPVLWSGVLIALSLCAYGLQRPGWGVICGVAAVFFRELALPYCLLAAVLAWRHNRRGELFAWIVGLAAWAIFFAAHWAQVAELIRPGDRAHQGSWIQFGGAGFVVATVQMNAYLLLLPQWVTALYLVAALCGLAGWNTPLGRRIALTACLYTAAFVVVGYECNQYWGCLTAPLWCFGVARFPASLADLWNAARLLRPASVGSITSG